MCVCVSVQAGTCECRCSQSNLTFLTLKLKLVLGFLCVGAGNQPRCSERAVSALNHEPSLQPHKWYL